MAEEHYGPWPSMMWVTCHTASSASIKAFLPGPNKARKGYMRIMAVITDAVMTGVCGRKRVGFLKWFREARRFHTQASRWYLHCLATFLLIILGNRPSIPELRDDEGRRRTAKDGALRPRKRVAGSAPLSGIGVATGCLRKVSALPSRVSEWGGGSTVRQRPDGVGQREISYTRYIWRGSGCT